MSYKEQMQSRRDDWKHVRRGYSKEEKNDYDRQVRDFKSDRKPRDRSRSRSRSRDRSGKEKDRRQAEKEKEAEEENKIEYKPNFGLSGALAKDERTGNTVNGVVLKFIEPFEAKIPDKNWRLFVYKGKDIIETLHIHRKSCYLFGKDERVADIHVLHESSSGQHAVIQFRAVDKRVAVDGERVAITLVKPYIMDLKSTNGTFLNGQRIEDSRYYELKETDTFKIGESTREYMILHEESIE
jgi:smad nuclear-interacting protein 1